MDLRPVLLPPPVSMARVEELSREIERIEILFYGADRRAAEEAVAAFAEQIVDVAPAHRSIAL
ncbi:hypothetical protein [Streptomyces sp. NBC_00989]|uniref:hypothetical protein n=1 Tax=Streptomyces sp. NBC_00989 TaxID=2903705 RepID=UPI00386D75CF|nr:hypothetical protein OG714_47830 [Streptomyces sp. NBC_00989]